jgi:hypothetical protein
VQELAVEAVFLREVPVRRGVPVAAVTDDGMPEASQVAPDLMLLALTRLDLEQAVPTGHFETMVAGVCGTLSPRVHEWTIHRALRPSDAPDQSEVSLASARERSLPASRTLT